MKICQLLRHTYTKWKFLRASFTKMAFWDPIYNKMKIFESPSTTNGISRPPYTTFFLFWPPYTKMAKILDSPIQKGQNWTPYTNNANIFYKKIALSRSHTTKWHFRDSHLQKTAFRDPFIQKMTFIPSLRFLNEIALKRTCALITIFNFTLKWVYINSAELFTIHHYDPK